MKGQVWGKWGDEGQIFYEAREEESWGGGWLVPVVGMNGGSECLL